MEVLDVATGTGNVARAAAQAGARVTALDFSASNLAAARGSLGAAGPQITWLEGDAEQLPLPDGRFDRGLSSFGAMFAPTRKPVTARSRCPAQSLTTIATAA